MNVAKVTMKLYVVMFSPLITELKLISNTML